MEQNELEALVAAILASGIESKNANDAVAKYRMIVNGLRHTGGVLSMEQGAEPGQE